MSDMKDRLLRAVRANLNDLLDRVREFEQQGGLRGVYERVMGEAPPRWEDMGWERNSSTSGARRPDDSGEKTIREYYANLEVPYGSDLKTVKSSYRRLMRKYHPDRYANDPDMEELATELSQELTQAYQAIESYLETGTY